MKCQALFLALLSVPVAAFVAPGRTATSVVRSIDKTKNVVPQKFV